MLDIPEHRPSDLELQVLVLRSLEKLGACTNLQLIEFMTDTGIMTYFELQLTLHKLFDGGHVSRETIPNDALYDLTDAGKEALRLFIHRAMSSSLKVIDDSAVNYLDRFKKERQTASHLRRDQREYYLTLEINEPDRRSLAVEISVPTAELVARYRENWPDKAQMIYDTIVHELYGEDKG